MPEIRKDPVVDRWVIVSAERENRPNDFRDSAADNPGEPCPFCPGHEEETPPEIMAVRAEGSRPDEPGWSIRVFPNKFPALKLEGEGTGRGSGLCERMSGVGVHEVIVETPDHSERFTEIGSERISELLRIIRRRITDLKRDARLRNILVFKNHGRTAGATLEHPHWQLVGTPTVPKRVLEELEGSERYRELNGRCVYCDIIEEELNGERRLVSSNDRFVALEPFASRFPFETWILPRQHGCHYWEIGDESIPELAKIAKETLSRIDRILGCPDFNLILHSSPFDGEDDSGFHWHMEIIPKTTVVSGFEWGSGLYINTTVPEEAAEILRSAKI